MNGAKVQVIPQARTTAFQIFLSDLNPANSSFISSQLPDTPAVLE
jgi:hypothetical protein